MITIIIEIHDKIILNLFCFNYYDITIAALEILKEVYKNNNVNSIIVLNLEQTYKYQYQSYLNRNLHLLRIGTAKIKMFSP